MKINALFMLLFLIAGAFAITTGELYTTTLTATSPIAIDLDWTDGNQTLLFGNWIISDSLGTVMAEGTQTDLTGEVYTADVQYTFSEEGTYTVTAMIVETHIEQTTAGGWGPWSFPALVASEQVTVTAEGPVVIPDPVCGDGVCDTAGGETEANCAADCAEEPGPVTPVEGGLPPLEYIVVGVLIILAIVAYLYTKDKKKK